MAIPIAACSAKPVASAVSASENGRTSLRVRASTPLIAPSCCHRHADQRSVAADLLAGRGWYSRSARTSSTRIASPMRATRPTTLSRPGRIGCSRSQRIELRRAAGRGGHPVRAAVEDVGDAVVGPAQPDGGPDDRVQDDLEVERGPAHDREDLVRRGLPIDGLTLGVVEPLPGERRRDPGLEDRGVDGLRAGSPRRPSRGSGRRCRARRPRR